MNLAFMLTAVAMFFTTIGPVDCAVIFANLTSKQPRALQIRMALKACGIAAGVFAASAVGGKFVLT